MWNSGYFLSYVDGLGTSYARSFLASTNTRFYKELDREMLNKRRSILRKLSIRLPWFADIKGTCPAYFKQQMKLCFLCWSLIKRQNTFFCNTFTLKFELMYLPEMSVEMT